MGAHGRESHEVGPGQGEGKGKEAEEGSLVGLVERAGDPEREDTRS